MKKWFVFALMLALVAPLSAGTRVVVKSKKVVVQPTHKVVTVRRNVVVKPAAKTVAVRRRHAVVVTAKPTLVIRPVVQIKL